jgi:putative RNA 2'-phosphotransferase
MLTKLCYIVGMSNFSKRMAYVLRHNPESIQVTLNEAGWVSLTELINAFNSHGEQVTVETIEQVVAEDNKQRYAIREGMIRANQGHSIPVKLGLEAVVPPERLFHGTTVKTLPIVLVEGLKPMSRHAVHLSELKKTALQVGSRHGTPVLLTINTELMHEQGYVFTRSENGVWLTEFVPSQFITVVS